jgi:glycosyltransferase involved in cell wall biosynthesis
MNKLSFVITTYKDFDKLDRLVTSLSRHNYLTYPISVLSDGDSDPRIKELCDAHGLKYFLYENAHSLSSGFKFWRNVFEVYKQTPTEYMIKLDADVVAQKPFDLELDSFRDFMFGTIISSASGLQFIQNGVRGFHSRVINYICDSEYFNQDSFFEESYKKDRMFNSTKRIERGLISTEYLMYKMQILLGYPLKNNDQILSYWLSKDIGKYYGEKSQLVSPEEFAQKATDYALVHPAP